MQYVCYVKDIPSVEGRSAQLALLRKQPKEAEQILLSANLIYRCIRMWIDLYNWDRQFWIFNIRALELSVKHKTHIDTVLHFRSKYLNALQKVEDNKRFLQLQESVPVDWMKIKTKINMELDNETAKKIKA